VAAPAGKRQKLFALAICLGLILSTLAVYSQVRSFDFVRYDDEVYVYENAHVQAGLTPDSVKWAFTGVVAGNWMPVTLLSHILDAQLFGMRSGMHHLVNVLFHALSAVLLFVSLRRATGAPGLSAFAAFVFALHPLHVESVAWVSERKDVLSTFFWLLTLYGYIRYAEQPSRGRCLVVAATFCLGLMSKPMLVTLPFTLWLFDLWPLRRTRWPRTIWEKLPLIALSVCASTVTYLVQRSAGAVASVSLARRIGNVFISYVAYIGQMFWPVRLAAFYPYPQSIPAWKAGAALAIVVTASVVAMRAWRTRPYLTMGWFWYLGTLVPVIGFVQVGSQAHADRYMYIPMIGLSVMLAWGAADVVAKWPRTKSVAAVAGAAFCAVCLALARAETAYWENSEKLFHRALEVTQGNTAIENDLGAYLATVHRDAEAIPHFEAALRINPKLAEVHYNLGDSLSKIPGRTADAIEQYQAALQLRPYDVRAYARVGELLVDLGRTEQAIAYLEAVQRVYPDPAISKLLDRLRAGPR